MSQELSNFVRKTFCGLLKFIYESRRSISGCGVKSHSILYQFCTVFERKFPAFWAKIEQQVSKNASHVSSGKFWGEKFSWGTFFFYLEQKKLSDFERKEDQLWFLRVDRNNFGRICLVKNIGMWKFSGVWLIVVGIWTDIQWSLSENQTSVFSFFTLGVQKAFQF